MYLALFYEHQVLHFIYIYIYAIKCKKNAKLMFLITNYITYTIVILCIVHPVFFFLTRTTTLHFVFNSVLNPNKKNGNNLHHTVLLYS